jgi:hypothetical protein
MDKIIPDVFKDLCRHFHQDVMVIDSTPEQTIASALKQMSILGQLNEERKRDLRQFLDELLSGCHNSAELREIWNKTPADIFFLKAKHLVLFLQSIRDSLE